MDLSQFFTKNKWWGKLIGAFLGYLIAGPAGALFGILLGNIYDRLMNAHSSRHHTPYHFEKRHEVKKVFSEVTFSVMGHIAKANGRISEQVIHLVNTIMQEMGLNHTQIKAARGYFIAGKNPRFNLKKALTLLHRASYDNRELIRLFADLQYRVARVDGLSYKKQVLLNDILDHLGFSPLNQQSQFYQDFFHDSNYRETNRESSSNSNRRFHTPPNLLDHAYGILEISSASNQLEVKRAYRRLMSKNHPDKLIARGLPEDIIKKATEKTQKIRKAYEQILNSKGW